MGQFRAVLFDFGGTLCTFGAIEEAAWANARTLCDWFGLGGQQEVERVYASLQRGIGRTFREYATRPFFLHREMLAAGYRHGLTELGVSFTDDQIGRAQDLFWRQREHGTALREGVHKTLWTLRERGLSIGIVSNSDEEELHLAMDGTGLDAVVDFALSSEAARSCKPDGGIFREALRRAGCAPAEALFVGDTPDHDVLGANHAGLCSVLLRPAEALILPWPRGDAEPNHVIASIPEVLGLIDLP
ncbi:MAG: HAD family hydrolase [Dehalococcoidia bacterium]